MIGVAPDQLVREQCIPLTASMRAGIFVFLYDEKRRFPASGSPLQEWKLLAGESHVTE